MPGVQSEKKNRFLEFWKRWNKVSFAVLATAGVVLGSEPLLLLAGADLAQNYLINRWQERRKRQKPKKPAGLLLVQPSARLSCRLSRDGRKGGVAV